MRKLKEVLRLHFELGLGQRQIAHSCAVGQTTVHEYLKRAEAAGVTWPLPEGWDDRRLEEALFGPGVRRLYENLKPAPDFACVHEELQRHPHLTLQLVWEEYRQTHPDGYGYSRFCELYQRWRQRLDVVLRQEHPADERLFVDFAGATIPVHDPQGGPVREASLFVAVLGASNYTYGEATWSQGLDERIGAHIRTFEFLGGVPKLVVPDNTRTGVSRACRYEPDLNRTYQELAMHYGVAVLPARPRKPRDKAKVEVGVQIVQRWIVAALRHRRFFSLVELNAAIRERLEVLNQRPFRKRPGCRASLFQELDRPALQLLPTERYELHEWSTARVNIDYPIEFERHYYSVPYVLTGQKVEIRSTLTTLEIFHRGERVASHPRSKQNYQATTNPASASETSAAPGLAAFATGELGQVGGTFNRPVVHYHPGEQAASPEGLPVLLGYPASGSTLLERARGSGGSTSAGDRRLQLSQHEIDPGTIPRPPAFGQASVTTATGTCQSARPGLF